LIAAYVPNDILPRIANNDPTVTLTRYGLIEVLRQAEYSDCSPQDFKDAAAAVDNALATDLNKDFKDVQDQIDRRCKEMNMADLQVGQPQSLGSFFSKTDAKGMGMLMVVKSGDVSRN